MLANFWAKVDASGDCWLWTASKFSSGYGQFWYQGHNQHAHRVAWQLLVGPIPIGYQVDHRCRVRACVNPDHLEPVTPKENVARVPKAIMGKGKRPKMTHCWKGHPLEGDNLLVHRTTGGRQCRTCKADTDRQYQRRRAA